MKWILLVISTLAMGATSMPQIPAQWEECELSRCKNEAVCFSDGTSEFCVCPEGYGGRQCERLLDSIRILDSEIHPKTLFLISTLLSISCLTLFIAAVVGWACCCSKHLNARRLYWRNMELLKENRALRDENRRHSHRGMRLFASLQRAHSLIAEEEEECEVEEEEDIAEQCGGNPHRREMEVLHAEFKQAIKEEEEQQLMTSLPTVEHSTSTLMKESREAREGRRRAASLNFPSSPSVIVTHASATVAREDFLSTNGTSATIPLLSV